MHRDPDEADEVDLLLSRWEGGPLPGASMRARFGPPALRPDSFACRPSVCRGMGTLLAWCGCLDESSLTVQPSPGSGWQVVAAGPERTAWAAQIKIADGARGVGRRSGCRS